MLAPSVRSPVTVNGTARYISYISRFGMIIQFLVFVLFIATTSPTFLTSTNVLQVLRQISIPGTIALGVTFVVICGRLDLSVGSLLSLTTVLVVDLHDKIGPTAAIAAAIAIGLAVGCVNGILVGFLRLNPLIATLGMSSVLQGMTLLYTGGNNVTIGHPETTWFAAFGRGYILGIPVPIVIFLGLAAVGTVLLSFTSFGRRVFAVGGNETASLFCGISVRTIVFTCYVISGLMTTTAGLIMGSRVMGSQNNVGDGYELQVLATIILGGTSLAGGSGGIARTVFGVVVLGFIQNGLLILGLPYYVQWLVTWAVIILAVWSDLASKRGRIFA
jgi:ribose/xylose/arabinose/galactoside ABC-type transport system permease subunit